MNKEKFIYKLLVEGNNDKHVVMNLCNHYEVDENFDIVACDGKDNLLSQFRLRLSNPSINQVIGVIVDADADCKGSLTQIVNILKPYGYELPSTLPKEGLILESKEDTKLRVGVWIMPNNCSEGMIEDFALNLIDSTDLLLQKAEAAIAELEKEKIGRYKPVHRSKAKIHTFLAWNDEPGMPIGQAITKNLLNAESGEAKILMGWISCLFSQKL